MATARRASWTACCGAERGSEEYSSAQLGMQTAYPRVRKNSVSGREEINLDGATAVRPAFTATQGYDSGNFVGSRELTPSMEMMFKQQEAIYNDSASAYEKPGKFGVRASYDIHESEQAGVLSASALFNRVEVPSSGSAPHERSGIGHANYKPRKVNSASYLETATWTDSDARTVAAHATQADESESPGGGFLGNVLKSVGGKLRRMSKGEREQRALAPAE